MSSRLDRIANWPEQARKADYCILTLAKRLGVSVSTVERYSRGRFKTRPKDVMVKLRMERARQLLREGLPLKQIAADLHYSQPQHFSRDFKKKHGRTPFEFFTARKGVQGK